MPARFCVLASGSAGNCAFLQANGFGLLIDIGLGPRFIASRLAAIGASWANVHAVLLTHTHSDHWKDLTLHHLRRLQIPLYCSPRHHVSMTRYNGGFEPLAASGLVRPFVDGEPLELQAGVIARPLALPHDSDPTYGFRIDGPPGLFEPQWSVGYASDLGECRPELVEAFADVNVLALEFNHCERMERASSRPRFLIQRVLSDQGHLSNVQAGNAVREIVRASVAGFNSACRATPPEPRLQPPRPRGGRGSKRWRTSARPRPSSPRCNMRPRESFSWTASNSKSRYRRSHRAVEVGTMNSVNCMVVVCPPVRMVNSRCPSMLPTMSFCACEWRTLSDRWMCCHSGFASRGTSK